MTVMPPNINKNFLKAPDRTSDPVFIFVKLITCPCHALFWSYRLLRNVLMSFWGLGSQAISICVGLSSIIELINLRK